MPTRDPGTFPFGPRRVEVVHESITSLPAEVDAVVSSDDNHLTHGGGVSAALWTAAGPTLDDYVKRSHPVLRLGDVFATPAGALRARTLLHAVTIDFDAGRTIRPSGIGALYRAVFAEAEAQGATSVGLPLLGSRSAGLTPGDSVHGFVQAVTKWLAAPSCVTRVFLADTNHDGVTRTRNALADLIGAGPILGDELISAVSTRKASPLAKRLAEVWCELSEPGAAADPKSGPKYATLLDSALRFVSVAVLEDVDRRVGTVSGDGRTPLLGMLSRIGHDSTHGVVESRSLQEVMEFVPLAAALVGSADTRRLSATLTSAMLARDRLAYGSSSAPGVDDRDSITAAVGELLQLAGREFAGRGPSGVGVWRRASPVPERAEDAEVVAGLAASLREPGRAALPSLAGTGPAVDGTSHVRRLHALLLTHLDVAARQGLDQRLQATGYVGSFESRLLEMCVREDKPVALLREFSYTQLARIVAEATGGETNPALSPDDLACHLLESLGFPRREQPIGLQALLRKVERAQARAPLAPAVEVRTLVADVSRDLEFVAIVLLRFLSHAAFREAPETLLLRWKALSAGQTVGSVGLGTLFSLIVTLDKHLEDDDSALADVFKGAVRRRRLFPESTTSLTGVRNSFAHYRERQQAATLSELRATASEFLSSACDFLNYLEEPESRMFPLLVLVDSIEVDRWGRKVVRATDDAGQQHVVFTDVVLQPGQVYFMRPLTNPLRVDPILVPAGQLAWPEV